MIISGDITNGGGAAEVPGAVLAGFNGGNAGLIALTTNNGAAAAINLDTVTFTSVGGGEIAPGFQGVGGNQTFSGSVTLSDVAAGGGASIFNTGDTQGIVQFNNLLNATAAEALTITTGQGAVIFNGAVGTVSPLGFVSIPNSNSVFAAGEFRSAGITAVAETSTIVDGAVVIPQIEFDGLITSTGTVDLTATDINIQGGITARGQNVIFDAGTSGVEISGGAINTSGDAAAIGGIIDIDSEGDVEITGVDSDLITSGGAAAGAAGFAGGAVTIDATGTGSITIGTGVDITTTGSAAAAGAGGAGGLVSMDTANQTITLTDTLITTSGGAGVGGAVGAGGAITFGSDVVNDSLVLATNGALTPLSWTPVLTAPTSSSTQRLKALQDSP